MLGRPTFPELLDIRRNAFDQKPELKLLYAMWAKRIRTEMVDGPSVELGSGTVPLHKFLPGVFFSDQSVCELYSLTCKTENLPFLLNSVGNFIMFDVFHHLADPVRFLEEAEKALKPGGRIIIVDLAITPFSYVFFNLQAKEKAILAEKDPYLPNPVRALPMRGNSACVHLFFNRDQKRFLELFPNLHIVVNEKRDFICFPLFKGYEQKRRWLAKYFPLLENVENRLMPLSRFFGMRTFLVLEKKS